MPESVRIKGGDTPVAARRLLSIGEHQPRRRSEATFGGAHLGTKCRSRRSSTKRSAEPGVSITIVGSPGIGKSRLVRETAAAAVAQGVSVFTTHCESHASDIPFHVVARMMRANTGIDGLDAVQARERVRERLPMAGLDDLSLLDDLLGISDPDVANARDRARRRRRRLTALVKSASVSWTPAGGVRHRGRTLDRQGE